MASNPYPLPNDELEKDRLDALQMCFRLLLGTNVVAPILKEPTQIGDPTLFWACFNLQLTSEQAQENGSSKSLMNIQPPVWWA